MTIAEVFPRPTVKQVVFQIRYPNLFFIEEKIGEYQVRIMEQFPESSLQLRRNLLIADIGEGAKVEDLVGGEESLAVKKIWRFASPDGVSLNVHSDSLDISSTVHKTYNNPAATPRFHDAIEFAVARFLEVVAVPKFLRIGLRYIDECPHPSELSTSSFREWYNSALPVERFAVEEVLECEVVARVRRESECRLTFRERLDTRGEKITYSLDFDGYAEGVPSSEYLRTTDTLHGLVADEFERTIKEPVIKHMRQRPEEDSDA